MAATPYMDSDSESDIISLADERISDEESVFDDDVLRDAALSTSAAAQAAKAIEVAEERSISPVLSAIDIEPLIPQEAQQEGILDAGPAPPDYQAATASRRNSAATPRWWNRDALQLMGDEDHDDQVRYRGEGKIERLYYLVLDTIYERTGRGRRRLSKRDRRKRLLLHTVGLLLVVIVVFALTSLTFSNSRTKHDDHSVDRVYLEQTLGLGLLHRPPPQCHIDHVYRHEDQIYPQPGNFTLIEDMKNIDCGRDGKFCSISGRVVVFVISAERSRDEFDDADLSIHLSTAVSNYDGAIDWSRWTNHDTLLLQTPTFEGGKPFPRTVEEVNRHGLPCLDFVVAMYVREDAVFTNWLTQLHFLSFTDRAGGSPSGPYGLINPHGTGPMVHIVNQSVITSNMGDIESPYWDSRDTFIASKTGDITGVFAFRDSLVFDNWAGLTDVIVDSKTHSPQLDVRKTRRQLKTTSRSGETEFYVMALPSMNFTAEHTREHYFPYWTRSQHHTVSGAMSITYPEDFEGSIDGFSVWSDVVLEGDGIRYEDAPQDATKTVKAWKGLHVMESGRLEVDSESGDVEIKFQDVKREDL